MATHHGKEGVVTAGGPGVGELTGFTLETTGDVVEHTALTAATKSFVAGRTSFSGTLEMNYDETDSPQQTLTAGSSISFIFSSRKSVTFFISSAAAAAKSLIPCVNFEI